MENSDQPRRSDQEIPTLKMNLEMKLEMNPEMNPEMSPIANPRLHLRMNPKMTLRVVTPEMNLTKTSTRSTATRKRVVGIRIPCWQTHTTALRAGKQWTRPLRAMRSSSRVRCPFRTLTVLPGGKFA